MSTNFLAQIQPSIEPQLQIVRHLLKGPEPPVSLRPKGYSDNLCDCGLTDDIQSRKLQDSSQVPSDVEDGSEPDASDHVSSGNDDEDSDDKSSSTSIQWELSSPVCKPLSAKNEPHTPAPHLTASQPPSGARGTKRKATVFDRIDALAEGDRSQRIKIVEVREKEKTVRAQHKISARETLEMARMRHQQTESEKQRQHELIMMGHQVELECVRAGISSQFGPGGPGPAGMAGPSASCVPCIDPSLFR